MEVAIVAAVADNGVIGRDGDLPWHLPADLARFKETTMGNPVVMGRRTYESIVGRLGGPLPGRTNVVLTSRDLELPEGTILARSLAEALDVAAGQPSADDAAYVVGGASVYEQALPLADRLVLTEVHRSPPGDTRFPDVDWREWIEVERDDREELSFVTYERRER